MYLLSTLSLSALLPYSIHALPTASNDLDRRGAQVLPPYSLPSSSPADADRAAAIAQKRAAFLYGPGVGGGPYSPTGPLGDAYVKAATAGAEKELNAEIDVTTLDNNTAEADIAKYNDLKTLDDYVSLYEDEWYRSTVPTGVAPGILTNYTQDLLFSMERLSLNPYAIRRLRPTEMLPFEIDAELCSNLTSFPSVNHLLAANRLFYVDHRVQGTLERTNDDKYAPACDAYFYISESSGDLLPLAIRTNVNNSLIYTPADLPNDWLLAKMMFNINDFFMGQFHHLANTHFVTEIVYEAAVRTLSDEHPVLAVLKRLMHLEFGIRPAAVELLLAPGADVDQYFGYSGAGAGKYSNDTYWSGYAGAFQSNYFHANLERRGLIGNNSLPALKAFPFYEDAAPIHIAIWIFMTAFVESYYASDADLSKDSELQAWLGEANGPAHVLDFPTASTLTTRADLVDVLTHMGHLVSSAHHAVNLDQLITASAVLPFHPTALYKPVPTAKGMTDVASYLPPLQKSLGIIGVGSNFARPLLAGTNSTLVHMFDDDVMLSRMDEETREANGVFMAAMYDRSEVISSRTFDSEGLSQGMPFVWQALDPNVVPWTMSI